MFNVKIAVFIIITYLIPSSYSLASGGCFPPVQIRDGSTSYLDESMKESSLNTVKVIKNLIPMDYKFKFKQYCVLGGCTQTSESSFVKLMYGIDISATKVYSKSKMLTTKSVAERVEGEVLFSLIDNYDLYDHGYELIVNGKPLIQGWGDIYSYVKNRLKTERLSAGDVEFYLDNMYEKNTVGTSQVIDVINKMNVNEPALVTMSGESSIPFMPDGGHMTTIVKESDSTFILIDNRKVSGPYMITELVKVLAKQALFKRNDKFELEYIITSDKKKM